MHLTQYIVDFLQNNDHTLRASSGQVAFTTHTTSTLNSYGYSPHRLSTYLSWIEQIFISDTKSQLKPFIISITASNPDTLRQLMLAIQHWRDKLKRNTAIAPRNPQIAVEFNTSCPNIQNAPPPSYTPSSLSPVLAVLADEFSRDPTLTLGLKLPPFVYQEQFHAILGMVETVCIQDCPIAFFSSTNTLGNSLLYPEQVAQDVTEYAVPTALGGLGGELIHPLSLGNVHTINALLSSDRYARLHTIKVIGIGGVSSKEAAQRMYKAGASVVGCASFFGKEGTRAFQMLSR
jgi:dihydroorotate dehydrogenase (fumarate)